jgi:hypothetical protein
MLRFHTFTIEVAVGIDVVASGTSCFGFVGPPCVVVGEVLHRVVDCHKICRIEYHLDVVGRN